VVVFEHLFDSSGGGDLDPRPHRSFIPGSGSRGRPALERGNDVRRYDDPVEVRKGWVSGPGHVGEGPEQFLWRGRLWQVRAVLAHWVETGSWWQSDGARAVIGSEEAGEGSGGVPDLLAERELWRVEASRGRIEGGGVFDLSFDWADGQWQLVGCAD
jgi:Family of unknown function (DUF6504)